MSDNSIMKSKTQLQVALDSARYELDDTIERVKELRVKIRNLRLDVAAERAYERSTRQMLRAAKRAERVAKIEQRLTDLRLKANAPKTIRKNYRKASQGVVYTPEQISELNKTLGLVEV
jgi:hypothetical protein